MCCRYWMEESPELRPIVEEMKRSSLNSQWAGKGEIKTGGEIRPADIVPVIAPDRFGKGKVYPMKWGYSGKSLLMNARSETAAIKPLFREDWARHRCIVPASCYFEWEHTVGADGKKHTGDKYRIRPVDGETTWLCGLYRIENGLPVFVVLTREPGEKIRFIHDRMPLILPKKLVNEWIRPDVKPEDFLPYAVTDVDFIKC